MKVWLGLQPHAMLSEKIVSTLGGFFSLLCIGAVTHSLIGTEGTLAIVPSMGAATVLLFAIPHGILSQPWALFCGNLVSAFVGVTCAWLIEPLLISAAVAVGLAIGAMHLCRCMHPPGGATALAAVIGGEQITQLGYGYLFAPVLINCVIIFISAMAFNSLFPWRRYPQTLMRFQPLAAPLTPSTTNKELELSEDDIRKAMDETGLVLDITAAQLKKIYRSAHQRRRKDVSDNFDFQIGGVYSNNLPGAHWAVRQVVDYAAHPNLANSLVIYKVLDGVSKGTTNSCTRGEFAEWAAQRLKSSK